MTNRHRAREIALQGLYSLEINREARFKDLLNFLDVDGETLSYANELYSGVLEKCDFLDTIIEKKAINWDLERLGIVDLSILRLSIYSLIFKPDIPKIVVINEGVNLSKDFCNENSYRLINGILDSVDIEVELSKLIKT